MRAHDIVQSMQSALAGLDELTSVGSVSDLAALAHAPPAARRPAAWVLIESERARNDTRFADPPGQLLEVRIGVVLCATVASAKAGAIPAEIAQLLDTMRHALWSIKPAEQLHFIEGAIQRVAPGELWWKDTWRASAHLIQADQHGA